MTVVNSLSQFLSLFNDHLMVKDDSVYYVRRGIRGLPYSASCAVVHLKPCVDGGGDCRAQSWAASPRSRGQGAGKWAPAQIHLQTQSASSTLTSESTFTRAGKAPTSRVVARARDQLHGVGQESKPLRGGSGDPSEGLGGECQKLLRWSPPCVPHRFQKHPAGESQVVSFEVNGTDLFSGGSPESPLLPAFFIMGLMYARHWAETLNVSSANNPSLFIL